MSAQNIIPSKGVEHTKSLDKKNGAPKELGSVVALGIILLVFAVVIMSASLIFMALSGSTGESFLLLGIAPFILIFMLLIISK